MDLVKIAGKALPWLTAALTGGPVGVATMAAGKIAEALGLPADTSISEVKNKLAGMQPAEFIKLQEVENSFALEMQKLGFTHEQFLVQAENDALKIVNDTMKVELENSHKEAWYQKAWRPANGFAVAAGSFVAVIFTCILFAQAVWFKDPAAINAIPALATAIAMILAVPGAAVGITAWKRSVEKLKKLKGDI